MAARPREPPTAPQAEHWYPIQLGSSLKDQPSKRFYSLRYEFKPASIDTSRPGTLHKEKGAESKVTVELSNNQPGKPKVAFQGISEDCKDTDAILFFDGRSFRIERLHRVVKTLRHLRQPGESSSSAAANIDNRSPLHLNGTSSAIAGDDTNVYKGPREHVEEIVIGGQPEATTSTKNDKKSTPANNKGKSKSSPVPSPQLKRPHPDGETSPIEMEDEIPESKRSKSSSIGGVGAEHSSYVEHIDISTMGEEQEGAAEHESDYEFEDVEVSEDEEGQLNPRPPPPPPPPPIDNSAPAPDHPRQQSSSSSGSSSSEGGSGSSSGSEGSDDESASLGEI